MISVTKFAFKLFAMIIQFGAVCVSSRAMGPFPVLLTLMHSVIKQGFPKLSCKVLAKQSNKSLEVWKCGLV